MTDDVHKVDLDDKLNIPMKPMKNTVVLAFSFFAVYTAFQGIQNITTSILQDKGLGAASLACIYASCIVTSIISPLYVQCVGLKPTFIIAFVSHCLFCVSNFYPRWWTLIPSSILLGLSVSPMWVSRHLYINAMGASHTKNTQIDLHGSLSKHNGIFFAFFSMAQVTGNFLSSVILHQSSADQSDLNQTKICGADDCPGIENKTTTIVRPDPDVVTLLFGIYLACQLTGLGATVLFLRPLTLEGSDRKSLIRSSLACCTVLKKKVLFLLMPLSISQAVNTSILLTGFTKAFVSCSVGVKMVGYVMMTFGIIAALSAITFGHVAKYTGRKPLIALTLAADITTLVAMLLWKPIPEEMYLLFIMPSIWAIGDGIWSTQINSLIAITFPNHQPAVFSNLGTLGSIGFTFVLITDRLMCLRTKFYIAIFLWALGVVGYIALEIVLKLVQPDEAAVSYHRVCRVSDDEDDDVVEFDCKTHQSKVD
ncbi:protein unc-93 homolog A-like isoform X1 [Haliotis cracherodii]|uniref:protein unc-93 homolog A-like isoform X1 n=1 Tax=Haliotis cracherodii TaxID=6455 RepID=UPI0039EAA581